MNDNIDAKGRSQTVSEAQESAQAADIPQEPCAVAARERTPADNRIHLTWKDIEAHRHVLSDLQWERITQYFHQRKGLSQIHAGDAGARRTANTSTEQCLGRASIRLLKSMLGMAITKPSQRTHFRKQVSARPPQESDSAIALALLKLFPDRTARMKPGPTEAKYGDEETGAAEELAATQRAERMASQDERPETHEPGGGDSDGVTGAGAAGITVGMRVEREAQGIWEAGRVLKIEGATATVSLDLGGETQAPLRALRIIPMR